MSAKVMGLVFATPGLKPTLKLVLLALADHGNDCGQSIYPSVSRLCAFTGLCERAVRGALAELRRQGYINIVTTNRQHLATNYAIQLARLGSSRPAPDAPPEDPDLQAVPTRPARDTARPAPDAPKPLEPKTKPERQAPLPPRPPAVEAFNSASRQYPTKALWERIDTEIGRDPENLQFWREVVYAWVAIGWNPRNVSGMLDYYKKRELPHTNGTYKQPATEPARGAWRAPGGRG